MRSIATSRKYKVNFTGKTSCDFATTVMDPVLAGGQNVELLSTPLRQTLQGNLPVLFWGFLLEIITFAFRVVTRSPLLSMPRCQNVYQRSRPIRLSAMRVRSFIQDLSDSQQWGSGHSRLIRLSAIRVRAFIQTYQTLSNKGQVIHSRAWYTCDYFPLTVGASTWPYLNT